MVYQVSSDGPLFAPSLAHVAGLLCRWLFVTLACFWSNVYR